MPMMLSVYCPVCHKAGKHMEQNVQQRLKMSVESICTDAGYELDDREPEPGEEEDALASDERIIQEIEKETYTCSLCGLVFQPKRTDPNFTY